MAGLLLSFFLQGFVSHKQFVYFPAPLKDPEVCLYFSPAKIIEKIKGDNLAFKEELIKRIADYSRLIDDSAEEKLEAKKINSFIDKLASKNFDISDIYFYFQQDEGFAFIVRGNFSVNSFKEKFPTEAIYEADNGFFVNLGSKIKSCKNIFIRFTQNCIVICPANISGNILEPLERGQNLLSNEFKVFSKMLKAKPKIAAEVKLAKLITRLAGKKEIKQKLLKKIDRIRVISSEKMNKFQFYVPNKEDLSDIEQKANKFVLPIINKLLTGEQEMFSSKLKGNSLFVSNYTGKTTAEYMEKEMSAMILHFIISNSEQLAMQITKKE